MILKENLLPVGHPGRPGVPLSNVTSITIHWVGPFPGQSISTVYGYWLNGEDGKGMQASAHYIIKDEECWNVIPLNEVAWHCGSNGNYTSIGIEVIPKNLDGEFSAASILTLRELLKTLPDVELKRHYDWTRKNCPMYYTPLAVAGEDAWSRLKSMLRDETWQNDHT